MENLNFYLEGVLHEKEETKDFEGPLSLILLLLQKNKIEIKDIKIAEILDQYLVYLSAMKEMNLEVASEFVQMAAYLLYIKTKTLIASDQEEVSELDALIESLEQLKARDTYVAIKAVAPELLTAYRTGALLCSKSPEPLPAVAQEYSYHHKPEELLRALLRVFTATGEKPEDLERLRDAVPSRIVYSIRTKSKQLLEWVRQRDLSMNALYAECGSHSEIVATFVALLELVSMGSVHVTVTVTDDVKDYILSSTGQNVDDILDKIED